MAGHARKKIKPGFVTADVLLSEVSEKSLRPFIHKCLTLHQLKRVGRCIHIFVANRFTPEAFDLAKSHGIIPATPENLFGQEVASALIKLADTMKGVALDVINADALDEIFRSLAKIEGAATNLRGVLFEYIVAEIVRQTSGGTVDMHYSFKDEKGKKLEIDVLCKQPRTMTFIECKGYQPKANIPDDYIETWLKERVPAFRSYALNHPDWKDCKPTFSLWTTGNLSTESLAVISAAQEKNKKYAIKVVDRGELTSIVRQLANSGLQKVVNEHFLEHPLATAASRSSRAAARKARVAKDTSDFHHLVAAREDE